MNFALRRRALIAAQKEYIIPPEYREIESITFTGEQWFDTGIYISNNTKIELDLTLPQPLQEDKNLFIGAYDGTYNCIIGKSGSNYRISYAYGALGGGTYTKYFTYSQSTFSGRKIIVADGEKYFSINEESTTITDSHEFTCALTAYFGNVHRTDVSYPAKMISRKAKIYADGTTLSRFYIPVRRLSDDVGGMWDAVNNTFNPSMTSTPFVKGADV